MRVLTLNIWNRGGPWEQRLEVIRAGVAALAPDVIALQEVIRATDGDLLDQAVQIADGFGYHVVFGRTPPDAGYPFGNAILSRWPPVQSAVFPLPRVGTDEYRNLLYADLDAPFGRLPFFVTHLNWRLHHGHVREAQVAEIADRIARLAPEEGFPPVLCGDFNASPDADEIRFLRGLTSLGRTSTHFNDAFAYAGDGSLGVTFTRKNPYAALLREPDRRVDYIFVRGPDDRGRGEPIEARVCFAEPVDGVYASDHFGVVATLRSD
jgi:endonuclease/exonuclease/phosphatase family metal-dependent hydrolase